MNNPLKYIPFYFILFILVLTLICTMGMYFDYTYKMKKLEMISQGKIKMEIEKI